MTQSVLHWLHSSSWLSRLRLSCHGDTFALFYVVNVTCQTVKVNPAWVLLKCPKFFVDKPILQLFMLKLILIEQRQENPGFSGQLTIVLIKMNYIMHRKLCLIKCEGSVQ